MNKKNERNVITEDETFVGTVDGSTFKDERGYTVGAIAYFGGNIGYVSFARPIGGMISGKLIPVDYDTFQLVEKLPEVSKSTNDLDVETALTNLEIARMNVQRARNTNYEGSFEEMIS